VTTSDDTVTRSAERKEIRLSGQPLRSRRAFLTGAGALGLLGLLAACGPAATPTPAQPAAAPAAAAAVPKPAEPRPAQGAPGTRPAAAAPSTAGPVAIGVSVWGDVTDKQTYDNITADFMKANPTVKVTPDQWVEGYYDKLQTVLAAGTAPDVLYTESYSWQAYAARGAFTPIDDYRNKDKVDLWPDLPLYRAYTQFRGKLYSVVVDTGNCVTFYLKEPFDKAGVPYPKAGWTIDQYWETARKLTDPAAKQYGANQQWNYLLQQPLWRANGVEEFDQVVEPTKAKFDDPVIVDTMQTYVTDAINKLKVTPAPADLKGGAIGLNQGNIAMYHTGPWYLPRLWGKDASKAGGVKFDVTPNPAGKSGKTAHFTDASNEQLNAQSKHKDEAWVLIKWIGSEEGQKRVVEGGRMPNLPEMTKRLWVDRAKKDYNFEHAEVFLDAYQTGVMPMCGGVSVDQLNQKAFRPAIDAMANGTSAKDAMAECQKNAQKMLDDYWAAQKK
jgi:multiple sugar transport system substrate-binding protein